MFPKGYFSKKYSTGRYWPPNKVVGLIIAPVKVFFRGLVQTLFNDVGVKYTFVYENVDTAFTAEMMPTYFLQESTQTAFASEEAITTFTDERQTTFTVVKKERIFYDCVPARS